MFLLNSYLGLFTATALLHAALLLANLRSYFAEFLNNSYLAHLRILSLTTCVRSRYGPNMIKLAAFLESWHQYFITLFPFHSPRAFPFS